MKGRVEFMYLRTEKGIIKIPKRNFMRSLFCKHVILEVGEMCSENGQSRISGADRYAVCSRCGKIIAESHLNYN